MTAPGRRSAPAPMLEEYVGRRVIVNLLNGSAIAGVLEAADGELVKVSGAGLHIEGRSPVAVGGEVIISLDNVDFVVITPP